MSSQFLDLRNLVSQKEREWKEAVELRLEQLEEDLNAKEATLRDRETKLERVKHDFKFNLQLLKDRDAEIVCLEADLMTVRRECHERQLANSESAVALDEARAAIKRLRNDKVSLVEEMDRHSAAHLSETERLRREQEAVLTGVRAETAARERSLDLEVVRLRQEVETQRREMLSDAERALVERDREQQAHADEMSRRALASELRVQMMEKEVEVVREGRREAQEKLDEAERRRKEVEEEKERSAMALRSEIALRDANIEQLTLTLAERDRDVAREEESVQVQRQQFEKAVNEREAALKDMRQVMAAEREEHQRRLDEVCATFDAAQLDFGQAEWRLADEVRQKTLLLETAQVEVEALRGKEEADEKRRTDKEARRDGELRNLRIEASERRDEARRLGEQLRVAVERERAAEVAAAQSEVEANRRVEEALETERERVDALVSGLVAKTTELNARLQAAEAALSQKEMFVQGLISERDLALQTLREHGIPFDSRAELRISPDAREEVERLRGEVDRLKQENVALLTAPGPAPAKETRKKKKKKKETEEEVERETPAAIESLDPDSRHVRDLVSNASRLRQERIQLVAQCRKQTVRIQNLESQADELRGQLRSKAAQVDKLEYEVGAAERQRSTEQEALKKRLADVEGQLAESRRETDEYYKGNLEQARIIEGLEQDLALIRARRPDATPQLNFGGHELLIQQLQDELEEVRGQLRSVLEEEGQAGRRVAHSQDDDVGRLRAKLKLAARKLVRLAEENSVLRQLSSHLRAALSKAGVPVPPAARPPTVPTAQSRLAEMEKLEYAIMRGRMQGRSRSHSPPERLPAESSDSGETESEPPSDHRPEPPSAQLHRPGPPSAQLLRSLDPDASLAELWSQLGRLDSSQSDVGELRVRGRALTPKK